MFYFAYGSNMLTLRLQNRVPSATAEGRARLPGMGLRFHKRSTDNSGKASLSPARNGGAVWGVVYTMDPDDVEALDEAEGRGYGYARRTMHVEMGSEIVDVLLYTARSAYVENGLAPYDWYHALVLAGALEHNLPDPYIALIRSVPTVRDPDAERRARHASLLNEAGYGDLLDANS